MSHLGEIAGVATSLSWTLCGLGFALAARRVGAFAVNQIRIVAAVAVLLCAHALVEGSPVPPGLSSRQVSLLAASGVAGLALGDLFYFHCISVLGPRLGMMLMATAPLFAAGLAWPLLGEALDARALLGIALTLAGVAAVVADPRGEPAWRVSRPASRGVAIAAGLLGGLGQGAGMVLAKLGMLDDGDGAAPISALSAVVVRMIAGMVGILLIAAVGRRLAEAAGALRDGRAMAATLIGVAFGPTLGVWLSLVALRHSEAGVASALCALPPVMMIPVARVAYGARPTRIAFLGTALAMLGTAVLFMRT
jgi:drug/metabolite transporter (DMT)-like permease